MVMTITHIVGIKRSSEDVFAFLSDFSNDPQWRANVVEMRAIGVESELGGIWSRQVEVRKVPRRMVETVAIITSFEFPRRLTVQRASGPIRPAATYELEEHSGETLLRFRLDVSLTGMSILLRPLVALFLARIVRPSLDPDFGRLKEILENME
jgi:hypothetical protein